MKAFLTLALLTLFLATVVTADPAKAPTYADVNTQAIELFQQGKYAEAIEREGQAIKTAEVKLSATMLRQRSRVQRGPEITDRNRS